MVQMDTYTINSIATFWFGLWHACSWLRDNPYALIVEPLMSLAFRYAAGKHLSGDFHDHGNTDQNFLAATLRGRRKCVSGGWTMRPIGGLIVGSFSNPVIVAEHHWGLRI